MFVGHNGNGEIIGTFDELPRTWSAEPAEKFSVVPRGVNRDAHQRLRARLKVGVTAHAVLMALSAVALRAFFQVPISTAEGPWRADDRLSFTDYDVLDHRSRCRAS